MKQHYDTLTVNPLQTWPFHPKIFFLKSQDKPRHSRRWLRQSGCNPCWSWTGPAPYSLSVLSWRFQTWLCCVRQTGFPWQRQTPPVALQPSVQGGVWAKGSTGGGRGAPFSPSQLFLLLNDRHTYTISSQNLPGWMSLYHTLLSPVVLFTFVNFIFMHAIHQHTLLL